MSEERQALGPAHALRALDAGFATLLTSLMVGAGMLLAAFMVIEVVLRYVLNAPFIGAEEISVLLGLWIYAMGMAYASRQNTHIAGGILAVLNLSDTTRRGLGAFAMLVCVVVAGVYAYYSLLYTLETFGGTQISSYMRWPYWIWTSSLTVGFALMTVYFLVWTVRAWRLPPANRE